MISHHKFALRSTIQPATNVVGPALPGRAFHISPFKLSLAVSRGFFYVAFTDMAECAAVPSVGKAPGPPKWIKPQLTRLAEEAPGGPDWLHEIKYDGYRVHARIDGDKIQLLTRTGLDWSHRYKRTIEALRSLEVKSVYLDGELCALNADGVPVFSRLQAAMDEGRTDQLVFFAFDLLFLNGQDTAQLPLIERKERLKRLFKKEVQGLRYTSM